MSDYKYIRAWGRLLRSYGHKYYINAQVKQARKDNAPANAIYFDDHENHWHTADEITDTATKATIEGWVK